MNKIVFVCLLSLSVCFSKPASDQPAGTAKTELGQQVIEAASTAKNPVETKQPIAPPTSNKTDAPLTPPANSTHDVPAPPKLNTSTEQTHVNVTDADTKKIETKTESVVTEKVTDVPVDNKTVNKTTESTTEKKAETKEADKSDTKGTDSKDKTDKASTAQTTALTPAPKPTASPADDAGKHAIVQSRSFDGASFVGGIILTLGLLAVSFMGFKYYKNQTERNYHTL